MRSIVMAYDFCFFILFRIALALRESEKLNNQSSNSATGSRSNRRTVVRMQSKFSLNKMQFKKGSNTDVWYILVQFLHRSLCRHTSFQKLLRLCTPFSLSCLNAIFTRVRLVIDVLTWSTKTGFSYSKKMNALQVNLSILRVDMWPGKWTER